MRRYLIVIESGGGTYSAFAPDVPGCVAAADTREAVEREMESALRFHFEDMQGDGAQLPAATTTAAYVEVPEAA